MKRRVAIAGAILVTSLALLVLWHDRDAANTQKTVAYTDHPDDTSTITAGNSPATDSVLPAELFARIETLCGEGSPLSTDPTTWSHRDDAQEAKEGARYQSALDTLAVAESPELLHAAALMVQGERSLALIQRALALSPNEAAIAWTAVRECTFAKTPCPLEQWEQRLLELDSGNADAWARVAANALARGDAEQALDYLQQAAAAGYHYTYFPDSVQTVERGLAAAGTHSFEQRSIGAIGFVVARAEPYQLLTDMCKQQSTRNAEWAQACIGYGSSLQRRGSTMLDASIGNALQTTAYRALGDAENVAAAERSYARLKRNFTELTSDHHLSRASETVIRQNPTLYGDYLERMKAEGELAAWRYMRSETLRILERNPEIVCTD